MTIAVPIRTGSAVVFAADSKLTTQGVVGLEEDGSPRWVDQTYDNATKVVQDAVGTSMVMVAGHANIGQEAATDYISRNVLGHHRDQPEQDRALADFVTAMVNQKRTFWLQHQVTPDEWPGPTVLLAAPGTDHISPRVWRINPAGAESEVTEILQYPHIWLEGSYNEAFSLIYGYHPDVLKSIVRQSEVDEKRVLDATNNPRYLRPIEKINFWTMPLQDAIDIAVFLASVQVEMDRFLPGTPACGGPIDVMVLTMAPNPTIRSYPGKVVHHPRAPS